MKRWLRFRLRTFLLFSFVIALLCSAYVCLPFATFEQESHKTHKVLKVRTIYPINSVMFDATSSLEKTHRIPEWQQRWFESQKGNTTYTSWNGLELRYSHHDDTPEWIIFDTPYFGYQYYDIHEEDGKLVFKSRVLPQEWVKCFAGSK